MMNLLSKIAAKPTDKTIRITRIIFALILIAVIAFGWDVTMINFGLPTEFKYALFIFPAIGLIRGILDPGIFRKKVWKWTIVGLGVLMFSLSIFFLDDIMPATVSPASMSGSGISVSAMISQSSHTSVPFSLSTDNWLGFFGCILIIIGLLLNSKNITTKNERHAEVIKKIRV